MGFIRNLIILTAALSLALFALLHFTHYALVHPLVWYILLFFVFVTGFTYYISELGYKNDLDNFQVYYFASMGFRMVLSIGVVALYIFFYEEGRLSFVLNFFALYFIFTGFEIYSLLANLRPNLKKQD